jgi:hypothetical protein
MPLCIVDVREKLELLYIRKCSGIAGTISINNNNDRINKWALWTFGLGKTSYELYMVVDITQPAGQVIINN